MPQALKLVIPGIVNTFIGLFKDTTLVLIIGLFDLLGIKSVRT
jgi:general L-amino acid transport system permease protein